MVTKKGYVMTFIEFNRRFESNITKHSTYEKAYEATERIHESETGIRKYSCYNSFRNRRNRKIKIKCN